MTMPPLLRCIRPDEVQTRSPRALDPETLAHATGIVEDVRHGGEARLRDYAVRLDGLSRSDPLMLDRDALEKALRTLGSDTRALFERTRERIRRFALAQRLCLHDLSLEVPGGAAGHTVHPVKVAGCYAPGGRYPLISSMLMTVVTARAAGVSTVVAASPRPTALMCAAAAVAGADMLLTVGGAQAIAALAYGAGRTPPCDIVVGPGNRWVTAAKFVISSHVGIDMLAGPSELLIVADADADPRLIAVDLLAQAEHDVDAVPMLIATSAVLVESVQRELHERLATLPTCEIARAALGNGFAIEVPDLGEAVALCNRIAPEHVELHLHDADQVAPLVRGCGALFIGAGSPEVCGDYGAGPNHTLPTGGTARYASGLSVFDFLRTQTWLRCAATNRPTELLDDAAALARIEGLEGHALSAQTRMCI